MPNAKLSTGASTSASPRVARKHNKRRELIMREAAVVVADLGYHGSSLETIAERLDLTRASLYHYFPSKDALLRNCIEFGADVAITRLETVIEEFADQSASERLRALIETQLDTLCRSDPELSRLFLTPMDWPESIRVQIKTMRERHDKTFRSVIEDGLATGEFTTPEPVVARHCMHGAMNYAPVWLRGSDAGFEGKATAIAESLVLLLEPRKGRAVAKAKR